MLAQLVRVLKPGGQLVIAEPYVPSTIIKPIEVVSCQDFANTWSDTMSNGNIGLTIIDKLQLLGYQSVFKFGSFVCIDDYVAISRFIDLSLFLGNLDAEQCSWQHDQWRLASNKGEFQLHWPMLNNIFTDVKV